MEYSFIHLFYIFSSIALGRLALCQRREQSWFKFSHNPVLFGTNHLASLGLYFPVDTLELTIYTLQKCIVWAHLKVLN
jgi:hypothetical protein